MKKRSGGDLLLNETSVKKHRTDNTTMRPSGINAAAKRSSGSGATGKKKMVIKPFKVKPQLPPNFEDTTWDKLKESIDAVRTKQSVSCSREELYRAVEDLCIHKMSANLYRRLEEECIKSIETKISSLVGQTPDHGAFLEMVDRAWQDHCEQTVTIRSIFLYLDRTYVLQTQGVRSIWDMGVFHFTARLRATPEVESKTIEGLLSLVEKERGGEDINRGLVLHLLRMFSALQIYEKFETPFLVQSAHFYRAEAERQMELCDTPRYLRQVERRLGEEGERVQNYLDPSTRKPVISVLEAQLLSPHVSRLLERGFDAMMDGKRTEDLSLLYSLLRRVDALDELTASLSVYVRAQGMALVGDAARDDGMVEGLLQLKADTDALLHGAFCSHEGLQRSLKDAFEAFVNLPQRASRPAELIAKYVDGRLRTGHKGGTDEEVEAALDKVMVLFRFIHGKDVFEAFFKKDLAKRLLLGKSASVDLEKSIISKLKTECGNAFTNKLEGMFRDVGLSRDLMAAYANSPEGRQDTGVGGRGGVEMSVHVLTTGFWPAYPSSPDIDLPDQLTQMQERFKQFYLGKHTGRRLQWQHSLGHCLLRASFPKGRKELSVSLYQTCVLMAFNGGGRGRAKGGGGVEGGGEGGGGAAASASTPPPAPGVYAPSFTELKEMTRIEDGELRRTLQSLACGKARVLIKQPKGREVADTDTFVFNTAFSAKLMRIKINSIQMKETVEENKDTHERVFRDRQYQVDAAIVRIMKTRKTLSHTLLMSELFNQLKFPATPSDLKKRIESLIDREYLERDENNSQVYNYLA